MISRCAIVLLATSFLRAQAPPAFSPMAYFQERCATCHGVPGVSRDESPGEIAAVASQAHINSGDHVQELGREQRLAGEVVVFDLEDP